MGSADAPNEIAVGDKDTLEQTQAPQRLAVTGLHVHKQRHVPCDYQRRSPTLAEGQTICLNFVFVDVRDGLQPAENLRQSPTGCGLRFSW